VLARGVAELVEERFPESSEAFEVGVRDANREFVRDNGAAHAQRAADVHLANETTTDLHGLQTAAERLAESTFDKPLEPALEPL
jgi:hypothetical protein